MQELKNIAKEFDIKGHTTMTRDELESSIKIPTVTFNAKKLTKWFNSIKDDQTVILFGSNGDLGFSLKENTNNIFFADRCNPKEKNFNKIHHKRFFKGNDDVIELTKIFNENLKKTLKECDTLLFLSAKHGEDKEISFIHNSVIPKIN